MILFLLMLCQCVSFEWRQRITSSPQLHSKCRVDQISLESLANKHYFFFGDSVTRYMYLVFVYMLTNFGIFPPHFRDGKHPSVADERSWGSWKEFYVGTSAEFGSETCDCYRQEYPLPPSWVTDTCENRYAFIESINVSVTYIQLFGYHNLSARLPIGFNKSEKLTLENYRQNEVLFREPADVGLARFFSVLPKADVVIVNSGHWEDICISNDTEYFTKILKSVEIYASAEKAVLIWRTTTRTNTLYVDETAKQCVRSRNRKWQILDATQLIKELSEECLWDGLHPHAYFHEELLRSIVGLLINKCDSFENM